LFRLYAHKSSQKATKQCNTNFPAGGGAVGGAVDGSVGVYQWVVQLKLKFPHLTGATAAETLP